MKFIKEEARRLLNYPKNRNLKPLFDWNAANIYFLLTNRFQKRGPLNDITLNRTKEQPCLGIYAGGDIPGITQKLNKGYFTDLALMHMVLVPVGEANSNDNVDEGSRKHYA